MSETLFVLLGVLKAENRLLYQGVNLVLLDLSELELLSLAGAHGHLVRGGSCM